MRKLVFIQIRTASLGPCVGTTDTVSDEIVVGLEQVKDIVWDMGALCVAPLRHMLWDRMLGVGDIRRCLLGLYDGFSGSRISQGPSYRVALA